MSSQKKQGVIWTPLMPDRRANDRRQDMGEYQTNSRVMTISDRRQGADRRKAVTITVTGRAMEVDHRFKGSD
ncbi:MAG: hypothetical protein HKP09_04045 [Enterobacterales bacterium]|nr:hypothetical protein [Enterobacterales bacterium]